MFSVNPWELMLWMGHKRIDETMLYVHFAEAHLGPLPEVMVQAQHGHDDRPRDHGNSRWISRSTDTPSGGGSSSSA
jgi:hypothetical protein